MIKRTPIENQNTLIESDCPLTEDDKRKFLYFGVNAKIIPPYRILNPQNIVIGDRVSIREGCHINAFEDLSYIYNYVEDKYKNDFNIDDYIYKSRITFENTCQVGRFFFMSCTNSITIQDHVVISERVFIGDNNHGFTHPHVPIMQQPNKRGDPVLIGRGSWIGVGAAVLAGTQLGKNSVVGANSVVKGQYPAHAVIAPPVATVLYRRHDYDE